MKNFKLFEKCNRRIARRVTLIAVLLAMCMPQAWAWYVKGSFDSWTVHDIGADGGSVTYYDMTPGTYYYQFSDKSGSNWSGSDLIVNKETWDDHKSLKSSDFGLTSGQMTVRIYENSHISIQKIAGDGWQLKIYVRPAYYFRYDWAIDSWGWSGWLVSCGDGTYATEGRYNNSATGFNYNTRPEGGSEKPWCTNLIQSGDPTHEVKCFFIYNPDNSNRSLTIEEKNSTSGNNYIYFDNTNAGWGDSKIQFVLGHLSYSRTVNMSKVGSSDYTTLYYCDRNGNDWTGDGCFAYFGMIGSSSKFTDGAWASDNMYRATHYSQPLYKHQNLASGYNYVISKADNVNGHPITIEEKGTGYASLNYTQTVKYQLSKNGAAYADMSASDGATPATITASSYRLSGRNSVSGTSLDEALTVNTTTRYSSTITACHTGKTTLTVSNVRPGYQFIGWYEGNTQKSTATSYTYRPTGEATVSARFKKLYAYVEGRFEVRDENGDVLSTASNGDWKTDVRTIPMEYDETNNRFVLHTHSTLTQLKANIGSQGSGKQEPYFFIRTSSSTSSWTDGGQYWAHSEGSSYQNLASRGSKKSCDGSSNAFTFTGSEAGYVVLYCDASNVWYDMEYTVDYKKNGGASGADGSVTGTTTDDNSPYLYNTAVTTVSNDYTNTGYKFKWWNTAYDGSGEDFYVGEKFNITANTLLYAQWESVGSDEEFWVGDNFTFSSHVMSVGDMRLKENNVDSNTDITQSYNQVSKYSSTAKKAKVLAMDADNEYLEVYFSDGSAINELHLGTVHNDASGTKKVVVIYSTTADFTSGVSEQIEVSIPTCNQSSKSVTDFSPSKEDTYKYARIYRSVSTAVYSYTGPASEGASKMRIYSIKAQKGTACGPNGLDYETATVNKTYGDAAFTNTLTNAHSLAVSYSSGDDGVATVNSSNGQVTIKGAGSTTITATWAGSAAYCEGTASYTLNVAKASISPSLSYDGTTLTAGDDSSSPTITGNSGNGTVTYASDDTDVATVDENTGVVTAVAEGTATITATIAATANYNGNTTTAEFTINAACTTPTIAWSTDPEDGVIDGTMTVSVTSNYPAGVSIVSGDDDIATVTDKSVDGSTVSYTLTYVAAGDVTISASVTGDGTTYCDDKVDEEDVEITVSKKTPTSYTASGGTFCSGAGVVTLSGSQSGIYYQLYNGASTVGDAKEGTGYALTWTSLSTAAGYTVKTVADDTYSAATMSGTATVAFYDAVSIGTQPTAAVNATVGQAASLSGLALASGTFNSAAYQWQTCNSDGSSASNITSGSAYANYTTATLSFTPASAGTYYFRCKVTDGCGTTVYSNVVTVTAKNQPAQYTVSGTASICSGSNTNITLSDSEDGVSYQLYKDGVAEGDPVDGTGDAIVWTVSAEGTYTVKAVGDANYWERAMSGSATVSFKTAASISTQPTTAVAATEGENFTLGSDMVVAGTGTKSYQWYSYSTSGGADETEIDDAESATYTTSKAAAGTYYYKVKVSADCGTATSNMITVTVTSGPCFTMTANTSAGSNGSLSHNESIAEGSDNCSDLDGGTAKYVDAGASNSMEVHKNYGWNFNHNDDQIIVTLSAGYSLQEGSVITMSGRANASGNGIQINGKTVYTKPSSSGDFADVTYTVLSTDAALKGANELVIKRVSGGVYLSSISFSGCDYCVPITPTLSYSKTTFWLDDDDLWCSPTLNKDGSTGTVTYTSSNSDIVWVGSSTGNIYAEKRGTATITASIAADGTHCAAEATCEITVKSIDCGTNTIAKATRSTTTASYSGLDGGSALVNNLDGSSYKLKSTGSYVGVQLPSSLSFREGDKIRIDLKIGDYWEGSNVGELPVVVYADNTGTNVIYTTDNYTKNTNQIVEFTVTSSMLTALNTSKKVTVYRTASNTQNHIVNSVEVKRYTCPDILVFNDAENDQSWSTAGNWLGKAGQGTGLPKDTDRVYIKKSVSVDATTATAGRVHIVDGAVMTVEKSVTMGKVDVETGSTLHVAKDGGSGVTLTLNTLYLKGGWNDDKTKYDMPRVYINSASSLTKTNNTVNFDISVNHWNYYPIALPFDVALNDVDYARSDLALESNYGEHYAIYEYDGQKRANYGGGSNNWKWMNSGSTLKAGKGYILSAITDGGKAIIRFPMTFTDVWTAGGEKGEVSEVTKNVIPVTAYENNIGGETSLANKGWNLIGVPYMSCYTTGSGMYTGEGTATLIQGRFDYETGKWTEKDANFYVTVPTHDFTEFKQSPVGEAVLIPGWCFFVQVEETGNLLFLDGQQASSSSSSIYEAPRREMSMPTLKTGIILSGNEASDQTTILVSDRYSASEYEINADLEKMFGETGYTLATYSLSGETRLAYNALSNAEAANIIPVGYRAPADGDYTFSINPRYAQNGAFESVNLIDYETGIVTDLLLYSYTFTTTRTQNDARFALNIVKRQDTTTDIENGASEANDVRKLIINDQLYIIVDGKMYDATGKAVK